MRSGLLARQGLCLCLAALTLSGCWAVGPDYRRPALDAPVAWSQDPNPGRSAGAFADVAWWKAFGDPILDELITRGLSGNLDIAQARARVRQARADVRTARAGLFPAIDLTGTSTSGGGSLPDGTSGGSSGASSGGTTSGTTTSTVYTAGFDATWELDFFGGQRRSVESTKATLQADIEAVSDARLTLIGDVATNYVALRAYQEQLAIARKTLETQRENAEVTKERFRLGLINQVDVAQAEGQAASTAADPSGAGKATSSPRSTVLGILVGLPPRPSTTCSPRPETCHRTAGQAPGHGPAAELLGRRPDLRESERKLAAALGRYRRGHGRPLSQVRPDRRPGPARGFTPAKIAGFSTWYWSVIRVCPGRFSTRARRGPRWKRKRPSTTRPGRLQGDLPYGPGGCGKRARPATYAQRERETRLVAFGGRLPGRLSALDNERYAKA